VEVLLENDPGKDFSGIHPALVNATCHFLNIVSNDHIERLKDKIVVVRKSFDGRWKKSGQPKFVYSVDVHLPGDIAQSIKIAPKEGRIEAINPTALNSVSSSPSPMASSSLPIIIVGAGPAGLFAALSLVDAGLQPIIVERGKPVEQRGLSIGALFNRKMLDPESNLCYGEGGAGTWSDGKLTTRIGKNSEEVRSVLQRLVAFGAPERILVDGKPHLGTDRLVRILKSLRQHLEARGARFVFNCSVADLLVEPGGGRVAGVRLANGSELLGDKVLMGAGHSARSLYAQLLSHGVALEPKPIAVGFRVEHPQDLINRIQFGEFGTLCERGSGKVPVADYRLAVQVQDGGPGAGERSCYSFCMCPGGQIVPTSVRPDELCVNGMSFSKRQSQWANSALVVSVTPEDMRPLCGDHPLRGVEWQRIMERRAAEMGGKDLIS